MPLPNFQKAPKPQNIGNLMGKYFSANEAKQLHKKRLRQYVSREVFTEDRVVVQSRFVAFYRTSLGFEACPQLGECSIKFCFKGFWPAPGGDGNDEGDLDARLDFV